MMKYFFLIFFTSVIASSTFANNTSAIINYKTGQSNFTLPDDLPLIVVPASFKSNLPLIFYVSGDGGWNDFSASFAKQLSQKGFTIIGLDARKYFWSEKTPQQATADISQSLNYYLKQFEKNNFILTGYSFGAGIVPFVASRLSEDLKLKLKSVVSLSPDLSADFEIHVSDMLGFKKDKEKYDVLAEEKKIAIYNPICFFGDKEDKPVTNAFKQAGLKTIILPGNHHYSDNYLLITTKFIEALNIK